LTCYFRHLKGVFEKAGIEVTSENRHELNKIIHGLIGVEEKNCPATWKEVKKRIARRTRLCCAAQDSMEEAQALADPSAKA
jgi:hypothetical protein